MDFIGVFLSTQIMYDKDDIIDDAYRVTGICSDSGGMGVILYIEALEDPPKFPLVLKICRDEDEESLKRFRREVRLLASFNGNSKVVQLYGHNLSHEPPYFVMKYYPDGDLLNHTDSIRDDLEFQESVIVKVIDCIQELHARDKYHRDIKPQNFLVEGECIVVSDFGLTREVGSNTAFTRSSVRWGTPGYIPPEFLGGGFKHADAAGDIFMIGKTIYNLLSGRDPQYLVPDGIPSPIFHVIERSCAIPKTHRYQSLADLKQSIVAAYDVLLSRAGNLGKVKQLLSSVNDRLEQDGKYRTNEVLELIEQLALLDESDQSQVCFEIPRHFFPVLGQSPVLDALDTFLCIYEKFVDSQDYSWSYAETVALNMQKIFSNPNTPLSLKAKALDLAIKAAAYMNRFAAMDTCTTMITSITDDNLGLQVASIITDHHDSFVRHIELSECSCDPVRNVLRQIQQQ